jgi:hypothetical protein
LRRRGDQSAIFESSQVCHCANDAISQPARDPVTGVESYSASNRKRKNVSWGHIDS